MLILGLYLGFIISGRSGRGPDLPRGVGGVPLGHFLNEYALRSDLVHFETQL